jgi:hypothetical protein
MDQVVGIEPAHPVALVEQSIRRLLRERTGRLW